MGESKNSIRALSFGITISPEVSNAGKESLGYPGGIIPPVAIFVTPENILLTNPPNIPPRGPRNVLNIVEKTPENMLGRAASTPFPISPNLGSPPPNKVENIPPVFSAEAASPSVARAKALAAISAFLFASISAKVA